MKRVAALVAIALGSCSADRAATPSAPDRQQEEPTTRPEPRADLHANVDTGCQADCAGTASPALVEALRARALDGKRCYDAALKRNRAAAGRIVLGLQIEDDGAVCATRIVDRQIDDPELATCIRELFLGAHFPAPEGGCVDVALPLNLVPADGADAGVDAG